VCQRCRFRLHSETATGCGRKRSCAVSMIKNAAAIPDLGPPGSDGCLIPGRASLLSCKPRSRRRDFHRLRTLFKQVHDRRFSFAYIRHRISINLPRLSSPPVRPHPFFDSLCTPRPCGRTGRGGRQRNLAPWRFGRVYLARSFKCARDLDAEVAQYRHAMLRRVMVEEDVLAVSPKPRMTANEIPDPAQGRPPRRANRAQGDPRAAPRPTCGGEQSVR